MESAGGPSTRVAGLPSPLALDEPPPVCVLGIGNVLLEDDGIGPVAIALLDASYEFPPEVELRDAGTPGGDLAVYLSGRQLAVLVDAMRSDEPTGTIRVVSKADLLRSTTGQRANQHSPALRETLTTLEMAGQAPDEVVLIGVAASRFATRTDLSRDMLAAVPRVLETVLAEVNKRGHIATVRQPARTPDLWWLPVEESRDLLRGAAP